MKAIEQYFNYLKEAGADVPSTADSFKKTLSNKASAEQYYGYLKQNKFDAPYSFDSFANTLGITKTPTVPVKKKDGSDPLSLDMPSASGLNPEDPIPSVSALLKQRKKLKEEKNVVTSVNAPGAIPLTPTRNFDTEISAIDKQIKSKGFDPLEIETDWEGYDVDFDDAKLTELYNLKKTKPLDFKRTVAAKSWQSTVRNNISKLEDETVRVEKMSAANKLIDSSDELPSSDFKTALRFGKNAYAQIVDFTTGDGDARDKAINNFKKEYLPVLANILIRDKGSVGGMKDLPVDLALMVDDIFNPSLSKQTRDILSQDYSDSAPAQAAKERRLADTETKGLSMLSDAINYEVEEKGQPIVDLREWTKNNSGRLTELTKKIESLPELDKNLIANFTKEKLELENMSNSQSGIKAQADVIKKAEEEYKKTGGTRLYDIYVGEVDKYNLMVSELPNLKGKVDKVNELVSQINKSSLPKSDAEEYQKLISEYKSIEDKVMPVQAGVTPWLDYIKNRYNSQFKKYPATMFDRVTEAEQNWSGEKVGPVGKLAVGFGNIADNTSNMLSAMYDNIFLSPEKALKNDFERLGRSQRERTILGYEKESDRLFQSPFETVYSDKIKSDLSAVDSLDISDDEKYKRRIDLITQGVNDGSVYQVTNPNAGNINLTGKSILNTFATVAPQILGSIGITAATGGGTGTLFLTTAMQAFSPYYNEAIEKGIANPVQYATAHTLVEAATEIIGTTNLSVLKKTFQGKKGFGAKFFRDLSQQEFDKLMSGSKNAFKNYIKQTGTALRSTGEESFEEFFAAYGGDIVNQTMFNEQVDIGRDAGKDFITTAIGSLPLNLIGIPISVNRNNIGSKFGLYNAASDLRNSITVLGEELRDGKITQKDYQDRIKLVTEYASIVRGMPKTYADGNPMRDDDKAKYAFNQFIINTNNSKESIPPQQKQKVDEVVKGLENENDKILSNATNQSQVQEGRTEGDIVQPQGIIQGQPEVGQGEGQQGQAQITPTNVSDSNIIGEGQVVAPELSNIESPLPKKDWAIITATQESVGAADDPANVEANNRLKQELIDEFGEENVLENEGVYLGVPQGKSFTVKGISRNRAMEIGSKYAQESVLTNDGNVFSDGSGYNPSSGKIIVGEEAKKQSGYSILPDGTAFSLDIEWDNKLQIPTEAESVADSKDNAISKALNESIPNVSKSLEKAGIKIQVVDPATDTEQARAARGNQGLFRSEDGTIIIDKSKLADEIEAGIVVWHEASHPVMNIIRNTNKPLYDAVVRGLKQAAKKNTGVAGALNWAQSQEQYDNEDTQNDESVVETIGRINAGLIDINSLDTGLRQKLIDFVNSIAKYFNIDPILNDRDIAAFKKTVSEVANALKTGRDISEIVGRENVREFKSNVLQSRAKNKLIEGAADLAKETEAKTVDGNMQPSMILTAMKGGKESVVYSGPASIESMRQLKPEMYVSRAKQLAQTHLFPGKKRMYPSSASADQKLKWADDVYSKAKDTVVSNLLFIYDAIPPYIRDISKLWYDGANIIAQEMSSKYGVTLEQASAVIATQSPQKPWYDNVHLAHFIIDVYANKKDMPFSQEIFDYYASKANPSKSNKKGYPKQIEYLPTLKKSIGKPFAELSNYDKAAMVRSDFDNNYERTAPLRIPTGIIVDRVKAPSSFSGYDTIAKGLSILENGSAENISANLGNAYKVRNFNNNIVNPRANDEVTIDTHAMAASYMLPLGSKSKEVKFDEATYAFFADAYREAAKQRGVLAREMQSITWEGARSLFPDTEKSANKKKAAQDIWNGYKAGTEDINVAQEKIKENGKDLSVTDWSKFTDQLFEENRSPNYVEELPLAGGGGTAAGLRDGGRDSRRVPTMGEGGVQSSAGGRDLTGNINKKLTDDGQGNYVFFHYSGKKLSKIDPSKFGANLATGRDERPGVGLSMYYVDNKTLESGVPSDFGYAVRIPKDKVYPFNEDPLNLYDQAKTEFEKDYPGQAFDANKQIGYITKVANDNGFDITVANWNIKGRKALRAQTTKPLKPEVYKQKVFKNGSEREQFNEELQKLKPGVQASVGGREFLRTGPQAMANNILVGGEDISFVLDYVSTPSNFLSSVQPTNKSNQFFNFNNDVRKPVATRLENDLDFWKKELASKTPLNNEGDISQVKTNLINKLQDRVDALQAALDIWNNNAFSFADISVNKKAQASAGNRLAPNGKPSNLTEQQYNQVRTPEFKNWFGDWENDPANASKVVDENDEPRVVYHGTNANFNEFSKDLLGSKNWMADSAQMGFFFAGSKKTSEAYTGMNSMDMAGVSFGRYDDIINKYKPELEKANKDIRDVYDRINREEAEKKNTELRAELEKSRQKLLDNGLSNEQISLAFNSVLDTKVDFNAINKLAQIENENNGNTKRQQDINKKIYQEVEARWKEETGANPQIMELFLSIKNPRVVDYNGVEETNLPSDIQTAIGTGKDGVIFNNLKDGAEADDIFVALSPNQIKSATGNIGAFSTTDNSIQASVGNRSEDDLRAEGTGKERTRALASKYGDLNPATQSKIDDDATVYFQRTNKQTKEAVDEFIDGLDIMDAADYVLSNPNIPEVSQVWMAAEVAKRLNAEIDAAGNNQDLKDDLTRKQADIFNEFAKRATSLGQAVQAFIAFRDNPNAVDFFLPKILKRLKKDGVENVTEEQRADIVTLLKDVNTAANGLPKDKAIIKLSHYLAGIAPMKPMDVLQAIWYAKILSGITTQSTNFFANIFNTVFELPAVSLRISLMNGTPLGLAAGIKGFGSGVAKGAVVAADIIKSGVRSKEVDKYFSESPLEYFTWSKWLGNKGKVLDYIPPLNFGAWKYIGRILAGTDAFFSTANQEAISNMLAYAEAAGTPAGNNFKKANDILGNNKMSVLRAKAQAKAEGFEQGSVQYKRRVIEIIAQKRAGTQEADEIGKRITMNYDPEGFTRPLFDTVVALQKTIPAIKMVIPFARIVANLTENGLNYTPFGFAKAATGIKNPFQGLKSERLSTEQRVDMFTKFAIGMSTLAILASNVGEDDDDWFEITAGGSPDVQKKYELQKGGWRPYTITLNDGTKINYKDWPIAGILAGLGHLRDAKKYSFDDSTQMGLYGYGFFLNMYDKSLLSGLQDFFGIFNVSAGRGKYAPDTKASERGMKYAAQQVKSVALSNLSQQTFKLYSELVTGDPQRDAKTFAQVIYRDIPSLNDGIRPIIDVFGDEVKYTTTERLLPVMDSPEKEEIIEWLNNNKLFVGVPMKKNIKLLDGTERPMTDAEYYEYRKNAGKGVKKFINEFISEIKDKEIGEEAFEKVVSASRQEAYAEILMKANNL